MLFNGLLLMRSTLCLNLLLTLGIIVDAEDDHPALGFVTANGEATEVDEGAPVVIPLPDLCSTMIFHNLSLAYPLATPIDHLQPSKFA
jgi:hypothetical protein